MGEEGKVSCLSSSVLTKIEIALLSDPRSCINREESSRSYEFGEARTRYGIGFEKVRRESVTPRSSSWFACLSHIRRDFYHLPEYAELSAESHRDELARAFIARETATSFWCR
jgi:hypothetical protein